MLVQKDYIILNKLLHILIKKGKKGKAVNMLLNLLLDLKKHTKTNLNVYNIIYKAFANIRPLLTTQKIRKSKKIYYLPKLIDKEQKIKLSLRWILRSVNSRKEKTVRLRLEKEFLDCFFGRGSTIGKKRALYNVILLNRPFLNFLVYK